MIPKVVSFTMTDNRARTIVRAIESALPFVDEVLIVDTGATDATIDIARAVAKERLSVAVRPWPGVFDKARNACLVECNALAQRKGWRPGCAWALMLDSDEWITGDPTAFRADLAAAPADVQLELIQAGESTTYGRERLFRLPTEIRFDGPTHEAATAVATRTAAFIRITGDDKTPAENIAKRERDVKILRACLTKRGNEHRWWYYLGDALQGLGRRDKAIEAYQTCVRLRGWDEEAAWAYYCIANCYLEDSKWLEAIDACALGLTRRADFAELAWLAGFASYQAGCHIEARYHHQAVRWSRIAETLGAYRGRAKDAPNRSGFSFLPGLYEGPFNVLRFALRIIGDGAGADAAEKDFQDAVAARVAKEKAG
jgi:glycosyltransferase involved in cell wall biosynthesis